MSPAERRELVDRQHRSLSIVRQCQLMGVSRSSLYYRPKETSRQDLSLMREMDRQYLETPFEPVSEVPAYNDIRSMGECEDSIVLIISYLPQIEARLMTIVVSLNTFETSSFYGSRRMKASLERQGMPVSRKRLMRLMGLRAIYRQPRMFARPGASPRSTWLSTSSRRPRCWAMVTGRSSPALATRRWSSKTMRIRSGLFCGSIYWAILVPRRFSVPKPLSQIHKSTLWLLQGLSPGPPSVDSG